jgi:hypothetical protein
VETRVKESLTIPIPDAEEGKSKREIPIRAIVVARFMSRAGTATGLGRTEGSLSACCHGAKTMSLDACSWTGDQAPGLHSGRNEGHRERKGRKATRREWGDFVWGATARRSFKPNEPDVLDGDGG